MQTWLLTRTNIQYVKFEFNKERNWCVTKVCVHVYGRVGLVAPFPHKSFFFFLLMILLIKY